MKDEYSSKLENDIDLLKRQLGITDDSYLEEREEKPMASSLSQSKGPGKIFTEEEVDFKISLLKNEYEVKRRDYEYNESRLNSILEFSKESNENLKNDYDLL